MGVLIKQTRAESGADPPLERQTEGKSGSRITAATALAAVAAILSASLANFLSYNSYPYLRPEIGLLMIGVLGVAGAIAILYAFLPRTGRCLIEGLLAAWFVDLNTDSIPLIVAAGVAVAAIGWWRRASLMAPMAVLGTVVLVTTVLGLGAHPEWIKAARGSQIDRPPAAKPAILHLLLDEHLGLAGLRAEGGEGKLLSDELRAIYLNAGFATYDGAYSRYFDTVNAVPDTLNYGRRLGRAIRKGGVEVGPTEHFKALADQGYRLTIFQSDYADYCTGTAFRECITYDSSSLRPTLAVPMSSADRAQLIALKFLSLSDLFKLAAKAWNAAGSVLPLRPHNSDAKGTSTVGSLESMRTLTARLASAGPGDAYFAHLLVPHYPYAVDRNCHYLPWRDWDNRHSIRPIEERRHAYYEQVRCTTARIQGLLDAFTAAGGPNSIIIIHGDHGSRITQVDPYEANLEKLTEPDVIAGYSTLFAIRAPDIRPQYEPRTAPIAPLLRDFTASGFNSAPQPPPGQPTVEVVARRSKKPVSEVPFPLGALEK